MIVITTISSMMREAAGGAASIYQSRYFVPSSAVPSNVV